MPKYDENLLREDLDDNVVQCNVYLWGNGAKY